MAVSPKHETLTAVVVKTVVLDGDCRDVEVRMKAPASGSDGVYVTVDGTDPSIDGDDCYWVAHAPGSTLRVSSALGTDTVKLISRAADKVIVSAVVTA